LSYIITFLLYLHYYILFLLKSTIKPANFPPGPAWLPIVGTLPLIKKLCAKYGSQHVALDKLRHSYNPDIISLKFGSEKFIVVFSQDLIKDMFTLKALQGRPDNFFIKMRTNGKRAGVTMTDGPLWYEHRQFLIKHLPQQHPRSNEAEGESIPNYRRSTRILPMVAVHSARSGWVYGKLSNILGLMSLRARAFQITGGPLGFFPWLRFIAPDLVGYTLLKSLSDQLYSLVNETIMDHKERLKHIGPGDDSTPRDFIDAFLLEMERGNETYTDDQLLAICLDMFIAGSETTSNTLDFAFLNMVLHPDVQTRVQEQIDSVLGPDEKPTYALKTKLPLVEAVLLECQRMYNVIPLSGAHRATEDTKLGGYNIPKDTLIMSCLYSMHYNPDLWDEPDKFKPERFLNPNGSFNYCDSLYQFGFGKRRCLGETLARSFLFIYFVGILHRYKITTRDENISRIPLPGISISPRPYNVILVPRRS
ncbi:methyl farnesoate epoxidase-like, partial [Diaphorina citri]|uniref:Methyl farnesoate epoxidase-like n=1 Tax=Diaphorina citri TaxID=121845 RepID=A0A3Q0JDQ4_DIACI